MDRTGSANNGSDAAERPFASGGRGSEAALQSVAGDRFVEPLEVELR